VAATRAAVRGMLSASAAARHASRSSMHESASTSPVSPSLRININTNSTVLIVESQALKVMNTARVLGRHASRSALHESASLPCQALTAGQRKRQQQQQQQQQQQHAKQQHAKRSCCPCIVLVTAKCLKLHESWQAGGSAHGSCETCVPQWPTAVCRAATEESNNQKWS